MALTELLKSVFQGECVLGIFAMTACMPVSF
jgi:hypothetical protein